MPTTVGAARYRIRPMLPRFPLALALSCLLVPAVSDPAAARPPVPLQQVVTAYIERYFELFPSVATAAGRHDFDERLEDLSPARRAQWVQFNQETVEFLSKLTVGKGQDPEGLLDAAALMSQARREILVYASQRRPERDPLYWTSILENASVYLLVRDDLPLSDRLQRVLRRTHYVPRLVRQAREALAVTAASALAPELCRLGASQARSAAAFHADGLHAAAKGHVSIEQALRREGAAAAAALRDLATFLDRRAESATGSPRLGHRYVDAFRWGTGIQEPLPAVLARARADLKAKRAEAAAFGRQVWASLMGTEPPPADDAALVRRLFERVAKEADPDTETYVRNWRATIASLESFVRSRRIMTLPDPVTLHVSTSPSYFLSQSVGGVYPAGPYAPEAKTLFFLPVPGDSASPEQAAAFFRDFNRSFNTMIAAHELVPGHYTQLKYAARHPRKVRSLFPDGLYVEGWGTFSERLLLDEGWGGTLPRLAHLKKQMENIARTIVDIRVHTEGMSREEVLGFVKDEALQGDQLAANMWMRSITSPVQLTTYYLGYQQMNALYEETRQALGAAFDLRAFTDGMMTMGPVAVSHYRPKMIRSPQLP